MVSEVSDLQNMNDKLRIEVESFNGERKMIQEKVQALGEEKELVENELRSL
jgi:FtsZ-binding cell division protein ZapB